MEASFYTIDWAYKIFPKLKTNSPIYWLKYYLIFLESTHEEKEKRKKERGERGEEREYIIYSLKRENCQHYKYNLKDSPI